MACKAYLTVVSLVNRIQKLLFKVNMFGFLNLFEMVPVLGALPLAHLKKVMSDVKGFFQ